MNNQPRHTMRTVARLSGLSPHVIRIWERRYNAVMPERSETDRRLYSHEDVERLVLLRRARESGHSIGQIAQLPTSELATLVEEPKADDMPPAHEVTREVTSAAEEHLNECYRAVQALDSQALEAELEQTLVSLGQIATMQYVIAPLMHRIGDHWREGEARVAQEHMASAAVRKFLNRLASNSFQNAAPLIVVATPAGQIHELGALMAAATADSAGWRVLYLGPNLPAAEIASAAIQREARAVALSIIYPLDDLCLHEELALLRRHLPPTTALITGGYGIDAIHPLTQSLQVTPVSNITELHKLLEELRQPSSGSSSEQS